MGNYTLANIAGALAQNMRDPIAQAFNRRARFFEIFGMNVEEGEGKNVALDVELDGANAENFTDGQDVASYGSDLPSLAYQAWALYRSNFQLTNLAASAAARSRSPRSLAFALARNILNGAKKLGSTLNGVMYSGAGTGTTVAGLAVAVDDSNTYMGIDRSSVAGWRAMVFDPGTPTDPTVAQIRQDLSDIEDACGEVPDVGLMGSAVWNKLANTFQEFRQINQDTNGSGAAVMSASVKYIEIDGCYFYKDKDCTANCIYYINSSQVIIQQLPFVDDGDDEWSQDIPLVPGLNARLFKLARTGAARKFTMETQVQLALTNPITCGKRVNVDST